MRHAGASDFNAATIEGLRIKRMVSDSRLVRPGDTFVAYPVESRDGRDFIDKAISAGAASVLWEPRDFQWHSQWRVPNAAVADLRRRAGEIASHVYGRPSARLWVVGVTGTNGKTSCSQWIAQGCKGHERYQSIRGVNHPFSDAAVAQAALRELAA